MQVLLNFDCGRLVYLLYATVKLFTFSVFLQRIQQTPSVQSCDLDWMQGQASTSGSD